MTTRMWYKRWGAGHEIKTWAPARMFLFRIDRDNLQGDDLFMITLHLLGRAFQYSRLS